MPNYDALNMNLETIIPEIIVLATALVVIFYDLFTRGRDAKSQTLAGISIAGYGLAFIVCLLYFNRWIGSANIDQQQAFGGMVVVDNLGLFFKMSGSACLPMPIIRR